MENHKKRLGRQILICYGLIGGLLAVMVIMGELSNRGVLLDSRTMSKTARAISSLLLFGGMLAALGRIRRLKKILSDQILLRDDALREADERRRFLYDRSGAQALNLAMGFLAVAVMILAYIDQTAFRTAYVTLGVLLALRFGLLAYYSRKY